MNYAAIDPIVRAVLYEGAILYPYRPSMKNVHRWTFGCLFPEVYARGYASAADAGVMQTQCIVRGGAVARVEIAVRFLRIIQRQVAWASAPDEPLESLDIGGRQYVPWQEVQEQEVPLGEFVLEDLLTGAKRVRVELPARAWREPIGDGVSLHEGLYLRRQEALVVDATVEASRDTPAESRRLFRLTVRVGNATPIGEIATREAALPYAMVSGHTILGVTGGAFISLTDPPVEAEAAVQACKNLRTWPVLAGPAGTADMMLSSPIILYDHPQVAAESPGEFFDGTEIDEMLTLRVLTLTDAEKEQMRTLEERTRQMLERTERQGHGDRMALHGALRDVPRGATP